MPSSRTKGATLAVLLAVGFSQYVAGGDRLSVSSSGASQQAVLGAAEPPSVSGADSLYGLLSQAAACPCGVVGGLRRYAGKETGSLHDW